MKKLIVKKSSWKERDIQFGISDGKHVLTGLTIQESYPIEYVEKFTITFDISSEEYNLLKGKPFNSDNSQALIRLIIERTYPEILL